MISLFPQLFTYEQLAPFILRIAIGIITIIFGYRKLLTPFEYKNFSIGIVEFGLGVFVIAGFLTQLAAGLIIVSMAYEIALGKNYQLKILLAAAAAALLFLGPGAFSIDLPL